METLSFTLGILTVIIVAFVTVLVWGVVKVVKQQKQIKQLQVDLEKTNENMYRSDDSARSDLYRRVDDMDRHAHEQMKNYITESRSYTDSRIDKLIDTYFEMKGLGKKQKKD